MTDTIDLFICLFAIALFFGALGTLELILNAIAALCRWKDRRAHERRAEALSAHLRHHPSPRR